MNVIDSSGWLEYFADGPNAVAFAPAIERIADALVPTLSLYEVFKRVMQQRDESAALRAVGIMQRSTVVDLTAAIALGAARLSAETKLSMADSVMLATTWAHDAVLWTQDAHFKGMERVRFIQAGSPSAPH